MVQNLLLSGVCKGSLAISLNNDDVVDVMLLPHRLLPLHLFVAPHQLLLLLQVGFLCPLGLAAIVLSEASV